MSYRVVFTEDAAADFRALDGSLKKLVATQLKKLDAYSGRIRPPFRAESGHHSGTIRPVDEIVVAG